jgi:hypothetical protein
MFYWLCDEHALPKTRVACVSRLIGNSDSTGKATHWQVGVLAGTAFGNKPCELGTPAQSDVLVSSEKALTYETPLLTEWRLGFRWSLASQ